MPNLFDPYDLRGLSLPNRIVVSPMCQYSANEGSAVAWHHAHLSGLALGGAGLLFVEATAVSAVGRITPHCLGLWSDSNEEALRDVVSLVRSVSPISLGIQLAHAGRKGSSEVPWRGGQLIRIDQGGWQTVAPSAVAHLEHESAPHALVPSEMARIVTDFVNAAGRAVRLGFEAIELHAAHGYLLHQFLSPVANRRADSYGGSLLNRMRFPLEVFDAVRKAIPERIPLGVRVSATDWLEDEATPSWNLLECTEFCSVLKTHGADWIDVSSAGVSPRQKIRIGPGYQVPFAQAIRQATGMTTIAVGMITEPAQANAIIASGEADLVALARAMLYDPRWAWRAAAALDATVRGPQQYWRGLPKAAGRIFGNTPIGMR
ncbi:MAG: NADH:flavin oxidoreductase/NADH oxidase [Burkholderiaceae bacterium]|jgi:NADPH2 dehydrogenase